MYGQQVQMFGNLMVKLHHNVLYHDEIRCLQTKHPFVHHIPPVPPRVIPKHISNWVPLWAFRLLHITKQCTAVWSFWPCMCHRNYKHQRSTQTGRLVCLWISNGSEASPKQHFTVRRACDGRSDHESSQSLSVELQCVCFSQHHWSIHWSPRWADPLLLQSSTRQQQMSSVKGWGKVPSNQQQFPVLLSWAQRNCKPCWITKYASKKSVVGFGADCGCGNYSECGLPDHQELPSLS